MRKLCPPLLKFLATPLPALVVGEENLVIGFGPLHFRNGSAIAGVRTLVSAAISQPFVADNRDLFFKNCTIILLMC